MTENKRLQKQRLHVGLSQLALANRSDVSRYRLVLFEAGGGRLTPDELARIASVIRAEARRLRDRLAHLEAIGA